MRRTLVAMALLALILAACGGGSSRKSFASDASGRPYIACADWAKERVSDSNAAGCIEGDGKSIQGGERFACSDGRVLIAISGFAWGYVGELPQMTENGRPNTLINACRS